MKKDRKLYKIETALLAIEEAGIAFGQITTLEVVVLEKHHEALNGATAVLVKHPVRHSADHDKAKRLKVRFKTALNSRLCSSTGNVTVQSDAHEAIAAE